MSRLAYAFADVLAKQRVPRVFPLCAPKLLLVVCYDIGHNAFISMLFFVSVRAPLISLLILI